ncbi:MAG: hypothetical protein J5956_06705 [Ruminococcus sp.]|nr:hypothetical protein [Ruminococcus sp.]
MEKLTLNTTLVRKQVAFETGSCVVEKVEAVSHAEFENLRMNALKDNDIIRRNKGCMFYGADNNFHCLLVYDKVQGDGLLVESEGYSYARLAQYIPQAKLIYEDFIQSQQLEQDETEDEEMDMQM